MTLGINRPTVNQYEHAEGRFQILEDNLGRWFAHCELCHTQSGAADFEDAVAAILYHNRTEHP